MNEQEKLTIAKRQLAAIKGFYVHLAVFVLVIAVLFVANATMGSRWWVQWPFLGWGIAVLGHAFAVFGRSPRRVTLWEQRKFDELKRRLDEAEKSPPSTVRPD